jgi:hypothetical protein
VSGLHYYDGHLTQTDLKQRDDAAFAGYDTLLDTLAFLESRGISPSPGQSPGQFEVITSGSPAFRCSLQYPGFDPVSDSNPGIKHRVSPGTVVFHDGTGERQNPDSGLVPAAVYNQKHNAYNVVFAC